MTDRSRLRPGNAAAAIILVDDGRYLLQLRDDKEGIFFPGHWGLFGGAVEAGERPEDALRRELEEELGLRIGALRFLARFDYNFRPAGLTQFYRDIFEVDLRGTAEPSLRLREGQGMGRFRRAEMLMLAHVVPYDAFALWFHANLSRLDG